MPLRTQLKQTRKLHSPLKLLDIAVKVNSLILQIFVEFHLTMTTESFDEMHSIPEVAHQHAAVQHQETSPQATTHHETAVKVPTITGVQEHKKGRKKKKQYTAKRRVAPPPGTVLYARESITLNKGRRVVDLNVTNTGDRPVQVTFS